MLKRQESSLSSSSRRQACAAVAASTTPLPSEPHQATAIGCMSGIFKLFSKYQNSRKRLTFGRKQENRKPSSPRKGKCSSALEKTEKEKLGANELNCDVKPPRIPSRPPEIRRSHGAETSPEDSRTSSSLVMRLIGLEDLSTATANRPASEEDSSVTEKRKQLLQALEKCNEDLEALKRIINAVQKNEVRFRPPLSSDSKHLSGDGNAISLEVKPCVEMCTDVAVAEDSNIPEKTTADELTRSPISMLSTVQSAVAEPKKQVLNKYSTEVVVSKWEPRRVATGLSSSRAMVENVEEVCRDIVWGEEREIGIIGLALQDHLWRELIQELVQELNTKKPYNHHSIHYSSPLPLEACKRRLCF